MERLSYAPSESAGAETPPRRMYDPNQTNLLTNQLTNLLTQDLAADFTAWVGPRVEIDVGEAVDQIAQVRGDQ